MARLIRAGEPHPASALVRPIGPLAVPRIKAAVARKLGALQELMESARPQPGEPS
jgi:hypothetical protein